MTAFFCGTMTRLHVGEQSRRQVSEQMNNIGWKTITGGILGVLGWAFAQDPITVETIVQGLGMILGIIGARHAVAKRTR